MRLFCLPCAGGGASTFHPWGQALPADIEVCAIQLPGRENRLSDPPLRDLGSLASALAAALIPDLQKPYALFGHSMGALLAFELVNCLQRVQSPLPVHLFAASAPAPHLRRLRPPLHSLGDGPLIAAMRSFEGLPEWLLNEPELLALVLPTLRADLEACDTYLPRPSPPLPCSITALGGIADATVRRFELAAWAYHTAQGFALRLFTGGHFFVAAQRDRVLDTISATLSPAVRERPQV